MAQAQKTPRPRASTRSSEAWAGSPADWKRRAGPHRVTLNSGMRALIRVLGMGVLSRLEALPDDLTQAVILHYEHIEQGGLVAVIAENMVAGGQGDQEAAERALKLTRDLGELTRRIVVEALIEPKMTLAELDEIPELDLEELMRISTGRQAFDAEGVTIGVEPLDPWAQFRHLHNCTPDCAGCAELVDRYSTVHVGDM